MGANRRSGRVSTGGAFTFYVVTSLRGGLAQLRGITAGPDGALWFCETNADVVGRITTAGVITQYQLPSPHFSH